jgi:hypothetical protein
MSITLTVGGVSYEYPTQGEDNWGEEATNWAEAVTEQLNSIITSGDIALTTANIANGPGPAATDLSSSAPVIGLTFEIATVKGAFVEYSIDRSTTTNKYTETGMLILTYNNLTTSWDIARYHAGSSGPSIYGVDFTCTNVGPVGQVNYTADSLITGTGYDGKIRYRARVIK